jgi:hypothetical protein
VTLSQETTDFLTITPFVFENASVLLMEGIFSDLPESQLMSLGSALFVF